MFMYQYLGSIPEGADDMSTGYGLFFFTEHLGKLPEGDWASSREKDVMLTEVESPKTHSDQIRDSRRSSY